MRKAIDYLRAHPVIAAAILVGIVAVYFLLPRNQESAPPMATPQAPSDAQATPGASTTTGPSAAQPSPAAPGMQPQVGQTAPPATGTTPQTSPQAGQQPASGRPAPVNAGRPDPFAPLVTAQQSQPIRPVAPPPPPIPPPLSPGSVPGQAPAAPPPPPPPPKVASGASVVGILTDSPGVAVIRVEDRTYIVSPGDVILNKIRVQAVDFANGLVVLEEDGERFELKMGGVIGPHVAATLSTNFN